MTTLKRNDIINTQNMMINKYNSCIDKFQFGEYLKIYNINNISKQELLSKFITYVNRILNQSNKQCYDYDFEQPFEPKKLIHRLTYIMFPACVFKFNGQLEVATLLDVCENWKDVSSAEFILIPNRKETIYYDYIYSINGNKNYNIYYAKSKADAIYTPPKRDRAAFTKTNVVYTPPKRDRSAFTKQRHDDQFKIKPEEMKSITVEKKIFEAAKINSRELSSEKNIIKYQYEIIKELFDFF